MAALSYFFMRQNKPTYLSYAVSMAKPSTLVDWDRYAKSKGVLFINGNDIAITPYRNKTFDRDLLTQLLNEKFIDYPLLPFNAAQKRSLREYLQKTLHQGGALTLMQTALLIEAGKKEYNIPGDNNSVVKIDVRDGAVFIEETVTVRKLEHISKDSALEITKTGNRPLIVAKSVQRIAADQNGKISHTVIECTVGYQSSRAKALIDQRSIIKRIVDTVSSFVRFFMDIKVLNSKSDAEKQANRNSVVKAAEAAEPNRRSSLSK